MPSCALAWTHARTIDSELALVVNGQAFPLNRRISRLAVQRNARSMHCIIKLTQLSTPREIQRRPSHASTAGVISAVQSQAEHSLANIHTLIRYAASHWPRAVYLALPLLHVSRRSSHYFGVRPTLSPTDVRQAPIGDDRYRDRLVDQQAIRSRPDSQTFQGSGSVSGALVTIGAQGINAPRCDDCVVRLPIIPFVRLAWVVCVW